MKQKELEVIGHRLAARHARNKARLERAEEDAATRTWALATTAAAVVVVTLMLLL